MLKTPEPVNVREILSTKGPMSAEEFAQLRRAIASDQIIQVRQDIESLLREVEAGGAAAHAVRAGIGAYLIAQHAVAERLLSGVAGDGIALYVLGLTYLSLNRPKDADAKFTAAAKAGYDTVECTLKRAGTLRERGNLDEAEAALKQSGLEGARRADYSYQMGCILSDRGDTYGAIEYFERAVDMDPHHSQALFRLAGENALHGNDEEAVRLYEQSLSRPPFYLGALLNLGLLYEDKNNFAAAAFCFRRILAFDPTHERALMYMKDIEATSEMYYDDDSARNQARLAQLLSRPVTDFELSVRSRNCLAGMNIITLGDLTKVTEPELLEGKNFGETSRLAGWSGAGGSGHKGNELGWSGWYGTHFARSFAPRAGDVGPVCFGPQPVRAGTQVHVSTGNHRAQRTGPAHAGRAARHQKLRCDFAQRDSSAIGRVESEAQKRLTLRRVLLFTRPCR